jgi:hypothetical protein
MVRELLIEDAEATAKRYREMLLSIGVCPSCIDRAPEPFGCSDCLNTGWEGGAPRGFVSERFHQEELKRISERRQT